MNDINPVITRIAQFLSTEKWWGPIVSFMYHNCSEFEENINTFDNFNFFLQFKETVQNLVDEDLCESTKITPDQFEDILNIGTKKYDLQSLIIVDILRNTTSYQYFHKEMVKMNKKIEFDVSSLVSQYKSQLSEPGVDKEKIAVYFSKILAKKESENLNELIEKSCQSTRKLLKLNPRKSRRANTYEPKSQKSVHLKPKIFATTEDIPEPPEELLKTGKIETNEEKATQNIPENVSPQPFQKVNATNEDDEEERRRKEDIARRRAFYLKQKERLRCGVTARSFERSSLPPLIRKDAKQKPAKSQKKIPDVIVL